MVKDIIITTKKNIKKYKIKDLNDVYECKHIIVTFSKKMKKFDKKLKFLKMKMYHHNNVKKYKLW